MKLNQYLFHCALPCVLLVNATETDFTSQNFGIKKKISNLPDRQRLNHSIQARTANANTDINLKKMEVVDLTNSHEQQEKKQKAKAQTIDPLLLNPTARFISKLLCHPFLQACNTSVQFKDPLPKLKHGSFEGALMASSVAALDVYLQVMIDRGFKKLGLFELVHVEQPKHLVELNKVLKNVSTSLVAAIGLSILSNHLKNKPLMQDMLKLFIGNMLAKTAADYMKEHFSDNPKVRLASALMVSVAKIFLSAAPKLLAANQADGPLGRQLFSDDGRVGKSEQLDMDMLAYVAAYTAIGMANLLAQELIKYLVDKKTSASEAQEKND